MSETTRHQTILGAIQAGIRDRVGDGEQILPSQARLDGLHALVTGANRGLGKAIAIGLAQRGAIVHLACRSQLEDALEDVGQHGEVVGHALDLEDPASIAALELPALDRVVLNAGMVPIAGRTTSSGLDILFHVNFLANVMLVDRLTFRPDARIVYVGSEAHRSAPPLTAADFGQGFGVPHPYGTAKVVAEYGVSKLYAHTWIVELGRRLAPDVAVHHLCPGAIASDIAREAPGWLKLPLGVVMRWFFQSPTQAAVPVLHLCTAPDLGQQTYLHQTEIKQPTEGARDPELGALLWDAAHRLIATLETR